MSKGFEVVGRTPDECLKKVCDIVNTQKYFVGTNHAIPVAIVKQNKDWLGNTVYQGIYKGIDTDGKAVIRKTKIIAYKI